MKIANINNEGGDFLQKLEEIASAFDNEKKAIDGPKPEFFETADKENAFGKLPDLFKIGLLRSRSNDFTFPALMPLKKVKGISFEINSRNREEVQLCIQHIVLQMTEKLSPSAYELIIIDPKKIGQSFRVIKQLVNKGLEGLIYDEDGIKKEVERQLEKSVAVINECLTHYSSLEEYNEATGGQQPYRIILVADFPYGFRNCIDKLNTLVHNGREAGVFFLMTYDSTINLGSYHDKVYEALDQMVTLKEHEDDTGYYHLKNVDNPSFYNHEFKLGLDKRDIDLKQINSSISERMLKLEDNVKDDISAGLRIPIGKVAGKAHNFIIGCETDNYHAIVGGQPGKGKTVLLNNIIARGIEKYSTDSLQFILLDCAGVGFQEFIDSNHMKALKSSSDVEECIKVIKVMEEELDRREKLFREARVAELKDYLEQEKNPLPRVVCIIDEFHVLFTGSSRSSRYVESILVERIIRIGRKFGIHLILSTQSLGGGVRRSILDNIPLRIALGMTADQSMGFLGYKNDAAGNLERGVAIYNNQNGALRANKVVRINYIKADIVFQIIERANVDS